MSFFDKVSMQRITYSSTISALNRAGQWQKALQQLVGDDRSFCLRVFEILLWGVGPYSKPQKVGNRIEDK